MPRRTTPLVTSEFYHVFNRSSHRQPILLRKSDADFFHELVHYYCQAKPPVKYSYFRRSPKKYELNFSQRLVTIISYCYMPNHFHFTLKQEADNGIQTFMQKIQNSLSHYFTEKYDNRGSLFESAYKAVHVETDEQLIHLSRYHHLNPVTAHLVKHPTNYTYSSYRAYMGEISSFIDSSYVMTYFSSPKEYEKFVLDQIEYQRELDVIKHLVME